MKLFGTDGIRGVANKDLTPELAFKIGRIAAHVLSRQQTADNKFLIARDTRISGPMLEGALTAGLSSAGVNVYAAGVISTPAAAYLTKKLGGCGGVMISASHNAYSDNGIKFFNSDGFKLPDAAEEEMEALFSLPDDRLPRPQGRQVGRVLPFDNAHALYLDYLISTMPCRLDGLRVVLDCANGAAHKLAPLAFRALGAEADTVADCPDGTNINHLCGSTHPDTLLQALPKTKANLGFSFDGDADRVLACDENGCLVDGDAIMTVLAISMREKGRLQNNTLVATVMSNLGLDIAAEKENFKLVRTKVGDRYVLEEMLNGNFNLGGEQSGHIIMLDYSSTGDGLLTALHLSAAAVMKNLPLSALVKPFSRCPQVLVNCRVSRRDGWDSNPRIRAAIALAEDKLSGCGRLLVRPSGTEPLIRIMMEGPKESDLHIMAGELAEVIKAELR